MKAITAKNDQTLASSPFSIVAAPTVGLITSSLIGPSSFWVRRRGERRTDPLFADRLLTQLDRQLAFPQHGDDALDLLVGHRAAADDAAAEDGFADAGCGEEPLVEHDAQVALGASGSIGLIPTG